MHALILKEWNQKKNLNAPKITPKEDRRTRCRKCLLILIIKYNFKFLIFFFQILLTVLHIMMKSFKSKISNCKGLNTSDAYIPMHKDFLVRYLSDVVKNYHCRGIDRPCKFLLFEKELNIFLKIKCVLITDKTRL